MGMFATDVTAPIPVAGLASRGEDRSMVKVSCMATALIVCLAGCAPTGSGPADPSNVGTDSAEPGDPGSDLAESSYDEVEQPSANEVAADEDTDTEEEGAGRESDAPPEDAAPPPAKKACPALDETTCKITVGCAWNTVDKCVDE